MQALQGGTRVEPRVELAQAMRENYQGWLAAIARCRFQPT
nr:chemoreceptor [Candidatus Pantoea persica]